MPNYKKMYFSLSNAVTDAARTLQEAQQATEERYIAEESSPPDTLFAQDKKGGTAAK